MPERHQATFVEVVSGKRVLARWPLAAVHPDLALVDGLARLQLTARRCGWSVRLVAPCRRLTELLDLAGLDGVLTTHSESVAEVGGETEAGEDAGTDFQERMDPGDQAG